ncbi:MAG: glycosyltransferase, partial [Slackia sp.]
VSSLVVARILSAASLNVVASKSEGFGLSIIEAMRAGVPSLVYEGIDAFVDFEGLRSVRSFATLSPQCLSEAMSACLAESYDASAIRREGQRYGLTAIIDAYLAVLERARTGVENG